MATAETIRDGWLLACAIVRLRHRYPQELNAHFAAAGRGPGRIRVVNDSLVAAHREEFDALLADVHRDYGESG